MSIGLLYEMITTPPEEGEGQIRLNKIETANHKGDLFTKELEPRSFNNALAMIRIFEGDGDGQWMSAACVYLCTYSCLPLSHQ